MLHPRQGSLKGRRAATARCPISPIARVSVSFCFSPQGQPPWCQTQCPALRQGRDMPHKEHMSRPFAGRTIRAQALLGPLARRHSAPNGQNKPIQLFWNTTEM